MITETFCPIQNNSSRYEVVSDNIEELITFMLPRIRSQSRAFYEREIKLDLLATKESLVDSHAGHGTFYILKLI